MAAAAKAHNSKAHLHIDGFGTPIFSIGNENTGAREFDNFDEAMAFLDPASVAFAEAHQCAADYQTTHDRASQKPKLGEILYSQKRPPVAGDIDNLPF
ncbi:MAG: hypothetical protein JZU64_04630 [Rhodoferax sp.]|nr:hypothetical protein [Rhodoferax sp.]